MGYTTRETQFQVIGPDGTVLWISAAKLGVMYDCVVATGATPGSATVNPGDGVIVRTTTEADNSIIAPWDLVSTGPAIAEFLNVRASVTTGDKGYIGVSLDKAVITSAANKYIPVKVAGTGSILGVNTIVPPASNAIGAQVIASATANKATSAATILQTDGTRLGVVLKTSSAVAGGMASTAQLGILVCPG